MACMKVKKKLFYLFLTLSHQLAEIPFLTLLPPGPNLSRSAVEAAPELHPMAARRAPKETPPQRNAAPSAAATRAAGSRSAVAAAAETAGAVAEVSAAAAEQARAPERHATPRSAAEAQRRPAARETSATLAPTPVSVSVPTRRMPCASASPPRVKMNLEPSEPTPRRTRSSTVVFCFFDVFGVFSL